jgi:hypothetical protein
MVSGGASLLLGRKTQTNLRALAMMNAMTMCAHQYEEYVDPGYPPGQVNIGVFTSDQPLNYPFNAHSAICANKAPTQLALFAWLGIGSTAPADNAEPDADSPALRSLRTRLIELYRRPFDQVLDSAETRAELGELDPVLVVARLLGPILFLRLTVCVR